MNKKKSKGTVLIVEDDMLLSLVHERLVVRLGYDVICKAASGKEAIRKVKKHNPDVIFMDILLKGKMDGFETMKKIQTFSDAPVIYLSGKSEPDDIRQAGETNYVDYLIKPVTAADIISPLENAMKYRNKTVRFSG